MALVQVVLRLARNPGARKGTIRKDMSSPRL